MFLTIGWSCSHREDLAQRLGWSIRLGVWKLDGNLVVECHVRSQEVVMCDDKVVRATAPLNALKPADARTWNLKVRLSRSMICLKDRTQRRLHRDSEDRWLVWEWPGDLCHGFRWGTWCGSIGRVGVGDEGKFLVGRGSADGFIHGDGGRESFAVIRDVIRRDGMFLSRCEQKDEVGFPCDLI